MIRSLTPWQCPATRGEKAEAKGSTGIKRFLISDVAMMGFCGFLRSLSGNLVGSTANGPEADPHGKPNRSLSLR